ncbi:hypothetical protein WMW72_20315 [Paenibacillus filicis]|uniref:Uncharacterized protein n=1 Tax=Paenibacillus filicis TaxID=669464 RepID=A0ABU9DN11_9BACL
MGWGISESGLMFQWVSRDELIGILVRMQQRLSPQKLMNQLMMDEDKEPMITEEMFQGNPMDVAETILEA